MKTSFVMGGLALAMAAGAAQAQYVGVATPLDAPIYNDRVPFTVYNSIPGPYQAFSAATGSLGFDDYVSTEADQTMLLARFRFVGGIATVPGTLRVSFFDSTQTLANSFTVSLPQAGNFIWNINLGTGDGGDSVFTVPTAGFVEIEAINGVTGQWFLTPTAAAVGFSDPTVGGAGGTLNHSMELVRVPAPAAAALFGMAGLAAARRRR